jgi:predicted transcriptional regulator of viral defense system
LRSVLLRDQEDITMGRSHAIEAGFDKLQELLLDMAPGDEVSVIYAREISGLDDATCEAVLAALMRAGLMMRLQHDAYVRVRLEATEQQAGKSPFNSV